MVKSFPQEGGKSAVECKVRRVTASEPCNPSRAGSIGLPRSNVDQAALFLQALNCKQIRRKSNNWVEACCPLAPWTHLKHADHSPSFGHFGYPCERSIYHCFACRSGSVEELLQTIELYAKTIMPNIILPFLVLKRSSVPAATNPLGEPVIP